MFHTAQRPAIGTRVAGGGRALAAAALALLVSVPASANQQSKSYEISVYAIRATKSNDKVSPELKQIARQLKKQFKYTGFKLEKKTNKKVDQGKTLTADLVGGYKVTVTPVAREGNRVKLKVVVPAREVKKGKKDGKKKPLLSTTFTITRGRYQLIGGGSWKIDTKGDDVLIIAVSAR